MGWCRGGYQIITHGPPHMFCTALLGDKTRSNTANSSSWLLNELRAAQTQTVFPVGSIKWFFVKAFFFCCFFLVASVSLSSEYAELPADGDDEEDVVKAGCNWPSHRSSSTERERRTKHFASFIQETAKQLRRRSKASETFFFILSSFLCRLTFPMITPWEHEHRCLPSSVTEAGAHRPGRHHQLLRGWLTVDGG